MTLEQRKTLVACLELTIHSQIDGDAVPHAKKVEMLDALHDFKKSVGLEEKMENEPE